MHDIFKLQWKLNTYILANIEVDYEAIVNDAALKAIWVDNFRKALSSELAEFVREVQAHGLGTQNGKIELVDMLHFLVSLSHLVRIEAHDISWPSRAVALPSFESLALSSFVCLDNLQNSLKWKWWAKGGGFKPDMAREAVLEMWNHFGCLCTLVEMDVDTLKAIYIAKNEVNFKRQDEHYNEDTKNEDDNQSIRV